MDVQWIINDACFETNTNIREYWQAKIISDLNRVYRKVWRNVVRTHEEYFWNYWTTDIQANVSEYAIQRKEVETEDDQWETIKIPWIAKVKRVLVKTNADSDYKELEQLDDFEDRVWFHWWTLKDNHIILSWTPDEDIEDWIKLEWIQTVNDLKIDDGADAIFPWHEDLQDFSDVLSYWLKDILWRAKQDFEKSQIAKSDFSVSLEDMLRYISERVQSVYYSQLIY